jgi:tetratricopeptide (TPR) repeat protein
MGRFDQALAEEERALEIDPLSPTINEKKGMILVLAHRYDQAIVQLKGTLELDQGFSPALIWLVRAYAMNGMLAESVAESRRANRTQPRATIAETLAMAYAAAGDRDAAMKVLKELQTGEHEYVPPFNLSYVYIFLKQIDRALDQLKIASEQRDVDLVTLKVNPLLDPLRADPRFHELLKRVNLAN